VSAKTRPVILGKKRYAVLHDGVLFVRLQSGAASSASFDRRLEPSFSLVRAVPRIGIEKLNRFKRGLT
jgi:hypothetical protein